MKQYGVTWGQFMRQLTFSSPVTNKNSIKMIIAAMLESI